jgi:hypothetical protein
METKLSQIKRLLDAGDSQSAIRIAARFSDLGAQRAAILDAHGAYTNPRFCRQIGKEPDALIAAGIAAMHARWPV